MLNVEQAIREVAAVYHALTGRPIEAGLSELPSIADPAAHVEQRYLHLKTIIDPQAAAGTLSTPPPVWSPPADIAELGHEVRYDIDLPSVQRDQVNISVTGDCLLIRGERPAAASPAMIRRTERPVGPFQKTLALSPRARRDGITAVLRDGVLSITTPLDGSGDDATARSVEVG